MNCYKDRYKLVKLTYHEGKLQNVELTSKAELIGWDGIKHDIPFLEEHLTETFIKVKITPAKEKIALFCLGYKAWTLKKTGSELAYKPSRAESGMIKHVKVTKDLLRVFFLTDFWTKEKTISNYVKHYNEIQRIEASKGSEGITASSDTLAEAFHRRYSDKDSH